MESDVGKIFVGNIAPELDEPELEKTFGKFGRIARIELKKKRSDRPGEEPYSFAFITYDEPRDADDAIKGMDGKALYGLEISAQPITRRGGRSRGGFRGLRGGFREFGSRGGFRGRFNDGGYTRGYRGIRGGPRTRSSRPVMSSRYDAPPVSSRDRYADYDLYSSREAPIPRERYGPSDYPMSRSTREYAADYALTPSSRDYGPSSRDYLDRSLEYSAPRSTREYMMSSREYDYDRYDAYGEYERRPAYDSYSARDYEERRPTYDSISAREYAAVSRRHLAPRDMYDSDVDVVGSRALPASYSSSRAPVMSMRDPDVPRGPPAYARRDDRGPPAKRPRVALDDGYVPRGRGRGRMSSHRY